MTLEASHNSENKIAVFSPHSHAWDLSERCYRPSGIALLCNLGLNLTSGMLGSVIPLLVSIMLCRGIAGDFQIPDTEETPAKDDTFQAGRVHPHTLTDREKTTKKMRLIPFKYLFVYSMRFPVFTCRFVIIIMQRFYFHLIFFFRQTIVTNPRTFSTAENYSIY